jgi:Fic family protein
LPHILLYFEAIIKYNRLMRYHWQLPDWPNFIYELTAATEKNLFALAERMGRVSGLLEGLDDAAKTETVIDMMVSEAVKTSEIEGEYISRKDVKSSIRNNLGLSAPREPVHDKRAEGAAALMVLVRDSYAEPLSEAMLFTWHKMLMMGDRRIQKGTWRTHEEPMQVVSGVIGKQKVHYEAPPSGRVPQEMAAFIKWFNDTAPGVKDEPDKPSVRAALAHVYFESIHPFEDGNGRIGRAISEKALSQGAGRPVLLSLSASIEAKRNAYYDALNAAQHTLDASDWIGYFVQTCLDAQLQAEQKINLTLKKAKLFDRFQDQMNERQLKAIHRMLEEEPEGFKGGMSAKKYMAITKASRATATRDLQDLADKKVLVQEGAGRSVRYWVNLD